MAWSEEARAAAKLARQRNRKDNRGDEFRNATARRLKRMRSAMKGVKRPGTVRERNAFIRAGAGNLDGPLLSKKKDNISFMRRSLRSFESIKKFR